jgi:hypothetical protein
METKIYKGGCHCGAVRFNVTTDLAKVITCNCSMCSRAGTMLTFVPADQFALESGEDSLSNYHFNKKVIDHLFCKHCGIKPFGKGTGSDGQKMVAVNIRCLDDFNELTVTPIPMDGKNY